MDTSEKKQMILELDLETWRVGFEYFCFPNTKLRHYLASNRGLQHQNVQDSSSKASGYEDRQQVVWLSEFSWALDGLLYRVHLLIIALYFRLLVLIDSRSLSNLTFGEQVNAFVTKDTREI